jgi:hypothetical protein
MPTGDTSTAKSPVALWDQERSGGDHRLADDHNRGKIDDVRFRLGDEYEEIFDCRGFRLICDTDEGLSQASRTDIWQLRRDRQTRKDRSCLESTRLLGLLGRMLKAVASRLFASRSLRVGLVEFQAVDNLAAHFYCLQQQAAAAYANEHRVVGGHG